MITHWDHLPPTMMPYYAVLNGASATWTPRGEFAGFVTNERDSREGRLHLNMSLYLPSEVIIRAIQDALRCHLRDCPDAIIAWKQDRDSISVGVGRTTLIVTEKNGEPPPWFRAETLVVCPPKSVWEILMED